MCVSVPGQVRSLDPERPERATVELGGVDREVSLEMLEAEDRPQVGDWVLVYLGMAMARIDESEAKQTRELIDSMNAASWALLEDEPTPVEPGTAGQDGEGG